MNVARLAMAILMALPARSLADADWSLRLAEFPNGKPLTTLLVYQPFLVIVTNNSSRPYTLWDFGAQMARNLDLSFIFKNEQEAFAVRLMTGAIDLTWNPSSPVAVPPGKSFAIKADFSVGDWINLGRLKGKMTVIAAYESESLIDPSKSQNPSWLKLPPLWKGKIESKPIGVTIR
jgi:hypothetical protein